MSAENVRFVISGEAAVRLRNLYSELTLLERQGMDELSIDDQLQCYRQQDEVRKTIFAVCRMCGHFEGPAR